MKNVKLVLIDGHSVLHRAYHALPPLTNKDGTQTNAVYGFVTTLLRILDNFQPTHLAVAFDLPQPTFRKQQYIGYQAKRPVMQSNLAEQIPLVHELLDKLEIKHFELAGFEADDIIGTLAIDSGHGQNDVVIVTGDRDMLQLINKNIKVCVSETKIYDEDLVFKEFGVKPAQWVDVKALKGDSSDNYPGVRGIGPKTAQNLIAKYETLENLYSKLDQLDQFAKFARKLAEGAEMAGLSQKLARIKTDVPLQFDLEKTSVEKINWQEGAKYMREKLGFKSLVDKIQAAFVSPTANFVEPRQLELI